MSSLADVCSQDDCQNPRVARGYCAAHYRRFRLGLEMILVKRSVNAGMACSAVNCDKDAKTAGYCHAHYARSKKGLNMEEPLKPWRQTDPCGVESCGEIIKYNGYCAFHAKRLRSGSDLNAPKRVKPLVTECVIQDCAKSPEGWGLCSNHLRTAHNYKLSPIQLSQIYARGCEICGDTENLHVDHDHRCCSTHRNSCGRCVRGSLCGSCNTGIGHLRDDPGILRAAIQYLNRNGIE